MKDLRFNPIYSLLRFIGYKLRKKFRFCEDNLGKEVVIEGKPFKIFREIYLVEKGVKKEGNFIFQVIFHSEKHNSESIVKRTNKTIPLFSGLPGFCNKKFHINEKESLFSGIYEWEKLDNVISYTKSFAVKNMKKLSKTIPLSYKIIDKRTGKVIIEDILEISK